MVAVALGARAATVEYNAILNGPSESPPNASPATGFADFFYNDAVHTLSINMSWSGLTGPTSASHIHAATAVPGVSTAGVATTTPYFTGFPIGVTSGSFSTVLDLTQSSSYNGSCITANGGTTATAETALIGAINTGRAYLNIHSQTFPNGEIRGFLFQVPEPSSAAILGLGSLLLFRRIRRRS